MYPTFMHSIFHEILPVKMNQISLIPRNPECVGSLFNSFSRSRASWRLRVCLVMVLIVWTGSVVGFRMPGGGQDHHNFFGGTVSLPATGRNGNWRSSALRPARKWGLSQENKLVCRASATRMSSAAGRKVGSYSRGSAVPTGTSLQTFDLSRSLLHTDSRGGVLTSLRSIRTIVIMGLLYWFYVHFPEIQLSVVDWLSSIPWFGGLKKTIPDTPESENILLPSNTSIVASSQMRPVVSGDGSRGVSFISRLAAPTTKPRSESGSPHKPVPSFGGAVTETDRAYTKAKLLEIETSLQQQNSARNTAIAGAASSTSGSLSSSAGMVPSSLPYSSHQLLAASKSSIPKIDLMGGGKYNPLKQKQALTDLQLPAKNDAR
jgi:hypothetical protein